MTTRDPRAVANWFIERGINEEYPLTHIEVQKLLYFAHGWMLGIHGEPLVEGNWEAWRYVPVLRDVYFSLNYNRGRPITDPIPVRREDFSEDELGIMRVVYGYRSLGTFNWWARPTRGADLGIVCGMVSNLRTKSATD